MIRPPTINLARRPFRNNTVYYAVFGACFALLMAASAYNVYDVVRRGEELGRLEKDLEERTAAYMALHEDVEKMKTDLANVNLSTLDSRSSFANGLIMSRLFSWSVLFDRLEDLTPPEVRVRSIRPSISTKGIEIAIDGLARTPDALYEFESNLGTSEYFTEVYPVSENSRETRNELNFDLQMNYVPSGKSAPSEQVPDTPTAGLPGPPEEETPDQAAEGAEDDEDAGDEAGGEEIVDEAAAQSTPADPIAAPQGAPQGAPGPEPSPEAGQPAATPGIPPGTGIPVPPSIPQVGKPLPEMTNQEFYDALGQDRFLRLRGRFKPNVAAGKDPGLTNQEFFDKYGLEDLMKERGGLDRSSQGAAGGGAKASAKGGGR